MQEITPLFEWNNTFNAADVDLSIASGECVTATSHIQKNREYYNDRSAVTETMSYTPYTYPHPDKLGGTDYNTTTTTIPTTTTTVPQYAPFFD